MYYYVYVLQSKIDLKWYVGYTKDLQRRFEEHKGGKVASTAQRRPLKLVYYKACVDKKDATHRERYFKTYHGKQFLAKRLKSYLTG